MRRCAPAPVVGSDANQGLVPPSVRRGGIERHQIAQKVRLCRGGGQRVSPAVEAEDDPPGRRHLVPVSVRDGIRASRNARAANTAEGTQMCAIAAPPTANAATGTLIRNRVIVSAMMRFGLLVSVSAMRLLDAQTEIGGEVEQQVGDAEPQQPERARGAGGCEQPDARSSDPGERSAPADEDGPVGRNLVTSWSTCRACAKPW